MRLILTAVAGCLLGLTGCAPDSHTLSGRVHFADGKPLAYGSVDVEQIGGKRGASAPLREDGTFMIPNLPAGEYAVSLSRAFIPGVSSDPKTGDKGQPPSGLLVNEKFLSPETSGLRVSLPADAGLDLVVGK